MTVDFNDYFWGEKNNGYDVLYHNMKYGLVASKELSDFFREKCNIEEHNSKFLTKLANKAGSGTLNGTFAPVWVILRSSAERLSSLHLQMVQKISELVKDVSKYADELHKKHKTVKEEESGTLDAVQAMQASTLAVQKAKDLYTSKLQELEKLKKDNGSPKDLEKAETKLRKQQDEYKNLVEKHNPVKAEFERRMTATCRRFQEIEEAHLRQMREFLSTYLELLQNNHDMVGQVHSDFKRQFLEMTVDKLLEQFVLNKYTGLEKPEIAELELIKLPSTPSSSHHSQNQSQTNTSSNINNSSNSSSTTQQQSGGLFNSSTTTPNASSSLSVTNSAAARAASPEPTQITTASSTKRELNLRNWFSSNTTSSRNDKRSETPANLMTVTVENNTQDIQSSFISPALSQLSEQTASSTPISGILRSRRDKAKTKKSKKKKDSETVNNKDEKSVVEEKEEPPKEESTPTTVQRTTTPQIPSGVAPTATPEVDEDGYSIQPRKETAWEDTHEKGSFYSSSDSDSENERPDKKIHVEIKPLNNGSAPISASVDELRATVGNISLSPIGILSNRRGSNTDHNEIHMKRSQSVSQQIGDKPSNDLLGLNLFQQHSQHIQTSSVSNSQANSLSQQQSPGASNASTPTAVHPYAPLQSPTLSVSNTSRYAELGDIFSEINELSASAPASASALSKSTRQIPTPTSGNSIAIPRPPSRRSETGIRGRVSPSSISRADSVGSMEFRTAVGIGSSRGPSPLTIGMSDTIPLAVAFHEIIHAYFRGSDESRCQVKMSGEMMLSFPAGIVSVLANNPSPAKLGFRIKNVQNLENVIPNKQLVQVDKLQSTSFSSLLEFNMPALTALLRRQSEQNPNASYFNVDILKYQMRVKPGASSCPLQLVSYWKCEPAHTALKIDYKYNSHAMASPSPLLNVAISVPVDGGVRNVQSKPHSAWLGESNRLVWNFTDISQHSEGNGVGTLRARLEVGSGPSTPSKLSAQFNCEGTTLSGVEFELVGSGYRLSLVKRRFVSGKYICEGDGIRSTATPTPPSVGSSSPYSAKSG
ncbi:F-BAR domain only protein 2 isoform X4 [Hermetia illucens]|uniref:F-BAR domain only protein 2 isoform X4 n=1 Tax=Hermetia illucens TaxID=343691 RepID=UPI0018CBFB47|nr:F-BAR domain only protein 2 isoform X4 [Hermetia illucens]